jgi:hypothetical protein
MAVSTCRKKRWAPFSPSICFVRSHSGTKAAEEIGDLQDRKERVGKDAGAEQRCDTHVAGKSEQPRRQRRSAHGGDIARERHETWPPHLL